MKKSYQRIVSVAVFSVSFLLPAVAGASVSGKTLKNLNTALQGESNAANRYGKFAEKAGINTNRSAEDLC